jgi:alpha-1,6-mannosyltransferase
MRRYARPIVVVCGLLLVSLTVYTASRGNLTRNIPLFLGLFSMMFVLYAAAVATLSRLHAPYRETLFVVFSVAVACRGINLACPPSLSNDIYRYRWEGRLVNAGVNPFKYAPSSPELAFMRDDDYRQINHPDLETIYPPAAQAAFALGARVGSDVRGEKAVFVFFDLATLVVLLLLLRARGENLNMCAVYAWNPLVLIEISHSGHMDSLGIFFLALSALLLHRNRRVLGFASITLSFLAKYLAAVFVPFFLFKRRYAAWVLLALPVAAAAYLPFADAGPKLLSSIQVYGRHWQFNSLLFALLHTVVENEDHIRIGLAVVLAAFTLYQGFARRDILRYAFRVIACVLLLAPTVYPWYVAWLVPFLCFHRSPAWLYFTGAVMTSYLVWPALQRTGAWELGWGVLMWEYVPFYTLLIVEMVRAARKHRRAAV